MNLTLEAIRGRHLGASPAVRDALGPVSLPVGSGECLAIIGPSGAGKTTLLHLIACALRPAGGGLRLDGADPWELSPRDLRRLRHRLILAPQTPPLPPRQRVVTAVLAARLPAMGLARSLWSLVSPVDPRAAWQALEPFGLGDRLYDRVDRLSGGERQRVGLARVLASDAQLWLIDEPLSALDPAHARQAIDTLLAAARQRGATLVASLHQVDLALECFPRIVGLQAGAVVFDRAPSAISQNDIDELYGSDIHPGIDASPPVRPDRADSSATTDAVGDALPSGALSGG